MSLFIKRGEIDKNGEINPDSDLGEKVDDFLDELDAFAYEFLSLEFKPRTVSGRDQAQFREHFEKNLNKTVKYYKDTLEELSPKIIKKFKEGEKDLKKCRDDARSGQLEDETVEIIFKMFYPNFIQQIKKWIADNEEIRKRNLEQKKQYSDDCKKWVEEIRRVAMREQNYNREVYDLLLRHMLDPNVKAPDKNSIPTYGIPQPTLQLEPLISYPIKKVRIPQITDERLEELVRIACNRRGGHTSDINSPWKTVCESHVITFLEDAYSFLENRLDEYTDFTTSAGKKKWWKDKLTNGDIGLRFIFWTCEFDDNGIPIMSKQGVADVYWSVYFFNLREQFLQRMNRFKDDPKNNGKSTTKKWIREVASKIPTGRVDKEYGLDSIRATIVKLIKAFSTKPPFTLSQRATIKQKKVKEYIAKLIEELKEAKKEAKNDTIFHN